MSRSWLEWGAGLLVIAFAWVVTGCRAIWAGTAPEPGPRIYFANHRSHGDFVLIWSVLPMALRARTRPVAAADYWAADSLRRFLGAGVFNAVLIDRNPLERHVDPVAQMADALDAGSALILFPEGTRNTGEEDLLPLKSGLYHLARRRPEIDLIPVWIENLNRVMPKGEFVPVPLLCTVTFGAPLRLEPEEDKATFLARARAAMLALRTPEVAA
ncbi:lysophospholipid acyltransferase family protein [Zavarzinia sp. CC-PAN008]|uniref:lysophospholipid acyltransferase family protein n=1 Tax=Zavarzinia sp. CC-PAN008 TaxID=3243332 RepID=UPI003F74366C